MMYCVIIAIVLFVSGFWYAAAYGKENAGIAISLSCLVPIIVMLIFGSAVAPEVKFTSWVSNHGDNEYIYFNEYKQEGTCLILDDYYANYEGVWGLGKEHRYDRLIIDTKGKDIVEKRYEEVVIPEVVKTCPER